MSNTITKVIMAKRIACETEEPLMVVQIVLQALLDRIVDDLASGKRIEFRDFGVFETRETKGRVFLHFGNGKRTEIPPKMMVRFKPGLAMKKRVEEKP